MIALVSDTPFEGLAATAGSRGALRFFWMALAAGLAASLGVAMAVGAGAMTIGSEQGHFVYPYSQPLSARVLWTFVVVCATSCALVLAPREIGRRHPFWLVIVWLLVGSEQQALLRALTPFTFEQMFVSDTANSFYSAAQLHRGGVLLRRFDSLRRSLPLHAQSNMPGKVLLVSGLSAIARQPAVQAWLVVAMSNLAGIFLYLLVLDWFGDRQMALFSLVLYLFVPGKLYFFPLLNTVTPVFALACTWLLVRSMHTGRAVYPLLFGVALYAMVLFEPLPLALGMLFAALALHSLWIGAMEPRTVARQLGVACAAFAATYVLFVAAFRFDLFRTLNELRVEAAAFNLDQHRTYRVWVLQNLKDFWFGAGVCQVVLFAAVIGDTIRRPWTSNLIGRPIAVVSFGLAAVLLAIDLLGVNRGEVTRLWLFLACFWQIPAAYVCARLNSRGALMCLLGATLLQDSIGTAMIGFVSP